MKKSIDLEYLKKGDLVSIVSIAKYITKKDCDFALTYIQSKGLNIFPLENTILSREGMFSGTNIKRKELLQSLLDNDHFQALTPSRPNLPHHLLAAPGLKSLVLLARHHCDDDDHNDDDDDYDK